METREAFDAVVSRVNARELDVFEEVFTRFPSKREEHVTFFVKDPSNNLIEFKYYKDESQII